MPAIVNAGNLLLVFIGIAKGFPDSNSITTPNGWEPLWHLDSNGVGQPTQPGIGAGYARVANGTEGGNTVNFATAVASTAAAHTYRVTNWFGSLAGVAVGVPIADGVQTYNPPSLTAPWGALDNLWFVALAAANDDASFTSAPTNYSNLVSTISGGGNNNAASAGSARREFAAATDDPGTGSMDSIDMWYANTVVVRPAGEPPAAQFPGALMMGGI